MAARCAPRAISVTASPARASCPPSQPPVAPAPTKRKCILVLRCCGATVLRCWLSLGSQHRNTVAPQHLPLPECGGDVAALDLAGRGAWDSFHHVDLPGDFEVGE